MTDKKMSGGEKRLPKSAHDRIARELQAYYRDLVNEPLPDKFAKLLEDLDERELERRHGDDHPSDQADDT